MLNWRSFKWWLFSAVIVLLITGSAFFWYTSTSSPTTVLQENGFQVSVTYPRFALSRLRMQSPIPEYTIRAKADARFTKEVLLAISNTFGRVIVIDCPNVPVTAGVLKVISQRSELEFLCLGNIDSATDPPTVLEQLNRLKTLSLHGRTLVDECSPSFVRMSRLAVLDLSETNVADKTIMRLSNVKTLQQLRIGGTLISDESFRSLASEVDRELFPHLDALFVDRSQVSNSIKDFLTRLPRLEVLDVSHTKLTDHGVKDILATCPNLRSVFLDGCDLDGRAWCETSWPKDLDCLTVQHTKIDGDTIIRMCQTHPSLRTILYQGCEVSPSHTDEIATLLLERREPNP
jgi:hypothetical protein